MLLRHCRIQFFAKQFAIWIALAAILVLSIAVPEAAADSAASESPATEARVASDSRPTLFLIGDSTVKNGRGDGAGGLWGWGQVLAPKFDTTRIRIVNDAIGGRSSRTFLSEGRWEQVLSQLRPGDFVLMQFGHNDGGELFEGDRPRASLKGNGDESRSGVVALTGQAETVHSYGWYLRRYIADTKTKGATPIVLSIVPRNIWKDEHVVRASGDYGRWATEAASDGGAAFVDLNEIVARRYDTAGAELVGRDYFTPADHTHTTEAGARLSAECVAEGLRNSVHPLAGYLADSSEN